MSTRFRAQIAYDGTDFHGSQYQPDFRTVQGEVEKGLRKLGWQGKSVDFAGRTDAGVHASGQVIAFDHSWKHSEEDLQRACNAVLPEDIAVTQLCRAGQDFHPRYQARARVYRYAVRLSPVRDPLQDRYRWRIWPELNLTRCTAAAADLVGSHDFAAFGSPHQPGGSTVRRIERAVWQKHGAGHISLELVGNAFLYHMVRHLVFTLVEIGRGEREVDDIKTFLDHPDGPPAPGLAPARGLTLERVIYPGQEDQADPGEQAGS